MTRVEPQLSTRILSALANLRAARMDGRCDHIFACASILDRLLEQWPTRRKV